METATTGSPHQSITSAVASRFDRVAGVYDETRQPLSNEAIDRASAVLREDGIAQVLEAGVGTGRIAGPLQSRGFDVVGLDVSSKMLHLAKAKGVSAVVLADANRPPFRVGVFDAVVLAHVLHLLDHPESTFSTLARVVKKELVVFLRKPDPPEGSRRGRSEVYQAFMRAATELGIAIVGPYQSWRERYARQEEFLARFPPTERLTIQELSSSTTLRYYLAGMEKRAFSFASELPEEDFHRIIERAKEYLDLDSPIPYHRVDQLAIWRIGQAHFD